MKQKEIVFATNNPHKLKEIREIIGELFLVRSLEDISCLEDIPEDAETLEENAAFKARFVYDKYGYDCFADDTGLEIDALGGRPGVRSARYAGEDCVSENNIRKVLKEMEYVSDRRARFRTVISLIRNGHETLFEGVVEGTILKEKHGEGGFGYDPIFLPQGQAKSFAQMKPDEKNRISHRGRAMQKLIAALERAPLLP
ncbi:MAG: non-canonical purine NTP diphosphatase [Bacteroidales bacterium]